VASALKTWWQKRFGYTLVEQDNGLYPSRMLWEWKGTFEVVSTLALMALIFFNNYFRVYHPNTQIPDLALVAYVLFFVLLMWLAHRTERRRFGPLGRPFVLVDQDTLALTLPDGRLIKKALPELRALHIRATIRKWPRHTYQEVRFEQEQDWQSETIYTSYNAATTAAIIDFLRRKLPASVHFTADAPSP
jgi:hypothetical protein